MMAADFGELCKNFRCMFSVNVTMRKFLSSRRAQPVRAFPASRGFLPRRERPLLAGKSELRRKQRNGFECNVPTRPTRQSCSFAKKNFSFSNLYLQGVILSSFFFLLSFLIYRLILLIECKFQ